MSETPKKSFSKFSTIITAEKTPRKVQFRTTQKKSSSVLMNPQSLNNTLPVKNISLPKIRENKKKRKYGTFLESWLDQALGQSDPYASQEQKKKSEANDTGFLRTLKKFQLDKQYLQSLNIPGAKIERLYQTLYIYSHGVDKIFKEMIQFVQQHDNVDLLGNFWRAYTKLMQSCTSYQTVFQKVEKDHLQNLIFMKHKMEKKVIEFEDEKKELVEKMTKQEKLLQFKENQFNQLKEQFQVISSTLGLTDEAFNDEVNLRLKFQQKINSVYTSYQQLKLKYEKIVEQMHLRKDQILLFEGKQNQLKSEILQQKVKVNELSQRLAKQKEKVKERQLQIVIKQQQVEDMKQILQAKLSKDTEASDIISEQIAKNKSLNVKWIESQNIIAGQKLTIKAKEQQLTKLLTNLDEMKEKNNKLYDNNLEYGKQIVKLQSEILARNLTIDSNNKKLEAMTSKNDDLNSKLQQIEGQRAYLQKQNIIYDKSMQANRITKEKNQILIEELKAVKDKYQRINDMLVDRIQELTDTLNKKSNQLNQTIEEIESFKLLVDTKSKTILQLQKQIQQERQAYKIKNDTLNGIIDKKQNIVSSMQKISEENAAQISDMMIENKKLQNQIVNKESQIMRLEVEVTSKKKELDDYERQIKEGEKRYQELTHVLEGHLQQKKNTSEKLSTTTYVLQKRRQEESLSIVNLRKLLAQYKEILQEKAQYVHPMIYEQTRVITIEAQTREKIHRKKFEDISISNEKLRKINKQLSQKNSSLQSLNTQLKQAIDKLQKSVKELQGENKMFKTNEAKNKVKIQEQTKKIKQYTSDIEEKTKIIKQLKGKVEVLEHQIQGKIEAEDLYKQQISKLNSKVKAYKKKQEESARGHTPAKIEKKVEKKHMEIQTDPIEQLQPVVIKQVEIKQTEEIGIQTEIEQPQQKQQQLVPKYETPYQNNDPYEKTQSPKKIEKKDFKKALKLTYMRR